MSHVVSAIAWSLVFLIGTFLSLGQRVVMKASLIRFTKLEIIIVDRCRIIFLHCRAPFTLDNKGAVGLYIYPE